MTDTHLNTIFNYAVGNTYAQDERANKPYDADYPKDQPGCLTSKDPVLTKDTGGTPGTTNPSADGFDTVCTHTCHHNNSPLMTVISPHDGSRKKRMRF